MDPNAQTPPADGSADPAAAAASVDTALEQAPVDPMADGLAAIDEAIAVADGTELPAKPAKPDKPADDAAAADAAKDPKDGKDPKDAKDPKDGKPPVDPAAKPEIDPEIDAEAKALGLKGKSNERFVSMATEIKTFAPIKAELEKAGIKDVSQLPVLFEKARTADDLVGMVMETGATPEQYGQSLDYLKTVNQAMAGDRAAAERAFEMVGKEYLELAKALGKEVTGLHDPLAEFPDLVAEVEAGDITRKRALELAGQRRQTAIQAQVNDQTTTANKQQQAVTEGTTALATYDAEMLAKDPSYKAKREALSTMVAFIKQSLPPAQWLAATQRAYATIPAPAVAAAPVPDKKPPPGPMRPAGAGQKLTQAVFDDPMAALDAALEATPSG